MTTTMLTAREQRALELLNLVPGEGLYAIHIRRVIAGNDDEEIREMMQELRQQAADCPKETRKLLGAEAFHYIKYGI